MNARDPIKSTQTYCAAVAFDREQNTNQARPYVREMPPFFTSWKLNVGLFLKPYNCLRLEWAPQYTSVTSGTVADIRRKKESNKCANVHPGPQGRERLTAAGRREKKIERWDDEMRWRQDVFQGVNIWTLQCTVWMAVRSAWLCWGCLSRIKYWGWDIGYESRELVTVMTWEEKSRSKKKINLLNQAS